ncbi:hypothetical protein HNP92_001690 [Methanococcus maripaludis]|uniref:Uncharacterized protein n=1 Tax=Methanococcus maripaludis TaxID=39152 RepID=A0A7J9SBH5_METMI|nr:hypothetical protein [Methanococcus maripaludis]
MNLYSISSAETDVSNDDNINTLNSIKNIFLNRIVSS